MKTHLIKLPTVGMKGEKDVSYIDPNNIVGILPNIQKNDQKSTVWLQDGRCLFCVLTADEAHKRLFGS